MCEAFQTTAAERGDAPALRLKDSDYEASFAEYAETVRRRAAGLAALGVGRGDTVGFMLVNRPAFQLTDTAAMHLGATCFSVWMRWVRSRINRVTERVASSSWRLQNENLAGSIQLSRCGSRSTMP